MFTPGDKLEYGHYTVLRELGAGGMGVVYHCRDEFLQREIAIKMLLPELMADDDTVEVFRQEARLAAQLEHPNVVTIHNIGIENKEGKVHHYIAMEFLPGGSLKQRIERSEKISLEQSLEWMKQLTIGLNYAHKRGVVHQDIKPDNIFITHDGNLKIGDFGLALIATGVAVERAVQGKGTPAYMSPELCQGNPQDHRSDIYSLGAVFYELLAREKPYKASGMIEMAMKHATAPVPSTRKLNQEVPEVLDKAVQKMMAKLPDERYQTLAEVLTLLEKLLLELQVARLGVGHNITSDATAKERPPALPNAEGYADEFANFLANKSAEQSLSTAQVHPGKPEAEGKRPKSQAPLQIQAPDETLDELLDALLADNTPAHNIPSCAPGGSEAPAAVAADQLAAEQDLESTQPTTPAFGDEAVTAASNRTLDEDVTGTIDAVLQSAVRAEAAAMAQRAQAARDSAEIGIVVPGPALDSAARISRTGMPALTGKERQLDRVWSYKTQGPIGWCSAPVLSKDRKTVLVGSSDGLLYALDAVKGNPLWNFDTGAAIVASPVVTNDRVFIASTNGALHALSPTGGKIWELPGASPLVATPQLLDDWLLIASMDGTVKLLSTADGKAKWTYRTEGAIVATPQAYEKLIFVASKDKCLHAVSADRGWRQWIYQTQAPLVSSPLVSTDSVYVGSTDGTMHAVEAESGRTIWKYPTEHPIVSSGTLEFTSVTVCSEDKWIYCIEKYKGGLMWKTRLHSPCLSSLVSHAGNLYVANREGWLQCLTLKNGELKWQMNCQRRLESTPLVAGKTLYLGMVSGEIAAFALPST